MEFRPTIHTRARFWVAYTSLAIAIALALVGGFLIHVGFGLLVIGYLLHHVAAASNDVATVALHNEFAVWQEMRVAAAQAAAVAAEYDEQYDPRDPRRV